nr:hypothetical protein Iba_chr07bCG7920 [Ipomoea batatas]
MPSTQVWFINAHFLPSQLPLNRDLLLKMKETSVNLRHIHFEANSTDVNPPLGCQTCLTIEMKSLFLGKLRLCFHQSKSGGTWARLPRQQLLKYKELIKPSVEKGQP